MARGVQAASFVRLNPGAISAFWSDPDGDELPSALDGWDAAAELRGVLKAEVDVPGILEALNLPSTTDLALGVTWRSAGTSLRGYLTDIGLTAADERCDVDLDFALSGAEVSGTVLLRAVLVYVGGADGRSLLAPSTPGSILWSSEHEVILEGSGARFPMEWADFASSQAFPPRALWMLDWDDANLERPLLAGLRLYLNSESGAFADAARSPRPEPAQAAMLEHLRFDVGRQLVFGVLASSDLQVDDEYPEESLGEVMLSLVSALFPDRSLDELRRLQAERPRLFESELQERMRLYG